MAENWTLPRGSTSKEKIMGLGETLEKERDCRQRIILGFPACATQWQAVSGRVRFEHYGFVPLRYQSENISQMNIEIYSSELKARNLGDGIKWQLMN